MALNCQFSLIDIIFYYSLVYRLHSCYVLYVIYFTHMMQFTYIKAYSIHLPIKLVSLIHLSIKILQSLKIQLITFFFHYILFHLDFPFEVLFYLLSLLPHSKLTLSLMALYTKVLLFTLKTRMISILLFFYNV